MPHYISKKTPFNWSDDDATIQYKLQHQSPFSFNIQSIKKDQSWNHIKHLKPNTKNICCHYFYEGFCSLHNCTRIHSHNIAHLRALFGQKFKSSPCKHGDFCKHAVCIFNHPIDNFILHSNGTPIKKGDLHFLRLARNKNRHIAFINSGNSCNLSPCPYC